MNVNQILDAAVCHRDRQLASAEAGDSSQAGDRQTPFFLIRNSNSDERGSLSKVLMLCSIGALDRNFCNRIFARPSRRSFRKLPDRDRL